MDRRTADRSVVLLLGLVGLGGLYSSWVAFQQTRAMTGMMGTMMGGSMPRGADGISPVVGSVLAIVVLGGLYLVIRKPLTDPTAPTPDHGASPAGGGPTGEASRPSTDVNQGADNATDRPGLLDVLPDDERRVLGPVIESPGITQIELRDRSGFSKSKVSQTVSDLEKRGLLNRTRQGRTFRVYPAPDVSDGDSG